MGLSLSRIYSSLASLTAWGKDKEVRILMVGLDSAGKTTILYKLQVSACSSLCTVLRRRSHVWVGRR